MALEREDGSQQRDPESRRTYASTVVSGDARLVQGDLSQDVNINGGLHLHFNASFPALAVAGSIIRFIHFSNQLLQSGREVVNNITPNYFETNLRKWERLSDELRGILSLLSSERGNWEVHSAGLAAEQALRDIVSSALADARKLQAVIKPLSDDIVDYLNPRTMYATRDDQETVNQNDTFITRTLLRLAKGTRVVASSTIRTTSKQLEAVRQQPRTADQELKAVRQQAKTKAYEEHAETVLDAKVGMEKVAQKKYTLANAQSLFLTFWEKECLEERLSKLLAYQDSLTLRLDAVLNAKQANDASHKPTDIENDHIASIDPSTARNDIVEVLSINKTVQRGLLNVAAIVTRQNGEIISIRPDGTPADRADHFTDTGLIRYDLRKKFHAEKRSNLPLVQNTPDFVTSITSALYFREEADRRMQVKEAHYKTFNWIFQETKVLAVSNFAEWLKTGHKIFFINGKAGSGKSTLMKYIYQHDSLPTLLNVWAKERQLIFGIFFFWYAGKPLQTSYEGVLRSLLHQILTKRPDITPRIFPHICHHVLSTPNARVGNISINELQEAVLLLGKEMPDDLAVFLMIDGVDEYSGDHYEFAKFLERLADFAWVKILVSSRPTSKCFQVFARFPNILVQDLTADDIGAYIDTELLQHELTKDRDILEAGFAHDVRRALLTKSSGVFLWIVIVVKKLLLGLGDSEDTHDLMKTIDELPTDLEHLYDLMFGRMSKENQRQGSLLLQLVGHARTTQVTPLTALQLLEAIKGHTRVGITRAAVSYSTEQENLRIKMVDGKLRSRCCGLVEVIYKRSDGVLDEPRVDFLHRTVFDYLCQEDVRQRLKSMHELKPREVNLNLLASSVHMLKRRALCPLSSTSPQACTRDHFSACLNYSEELAVTVDPAFLSFLVAADASYLECCRQGPETKRKELYLEAYQIYASVRGYQQPSIASTIEQEADLDTFAALLGAQLGPTQYFEKKVKTDPSTKSLMLLHLLNLSRTCHSQIFAERYLKNIKILIDCGVNPELPATYASGSEPPTSSTDIFVDAAKLAVRGGIVTPWNFWLLACRSHIVYHLEITLLLIEAGAKVHEFDANEFKVQALKKMKTSLQKTMRSVEDIAISTDRNDGDSSVTTGMQRTVGQTQKEKQRERDDILALTKKLMGAIGSTTSASSKKRKEYADPTDQTDLPKKHRSLN